MGAFHDYAVSHPEELTDYGRLVHFDFPALLAKMECAAKL